MEGKEGKKRRLDHELGDGSKPAVSDSGSDKEANPVFLLAQNRALATNLFRFKQRIAQLEGDLSTCDVARRDASDGASLLGRKVTLFQSDLCTAFERLRRNPAVTPLHGPGIELQDAEEEAVYAQLVTTEAPYMPASAASLSLPANGTSAAATSSASRPSSSSSSAASAVGSTAAASSPLYPPPPSGALDPLWNGTGCGGSSSSAATYSFSAVAATISDRVAFLTRATAVLIAAVNRALPPPAATSAAASLSAMDGAPGAHSASSLTSPLFAAAPAPAPPSASSASTFATPAQERHRACHTELLLLRDALASRDQTAALVHGKATRLEADLLRATRTLERLRYDHPGLDIDAHVGNPIPHGIAAPTHAVDGMLSVTGGGGGGGLYRDHGATGDGGGARGGLAGAAAVESTESAFVSTHAGGSTPRHGEPGGGAAQSHAASAAGRHAMLQGGELLPPARVSSQGGAPDNAYPGLFGGCDPSLDGGGDATPFFVQSSSSSSSATTAAQVQALEASLANAREELSSLHDELDVIRGLAEDRLADTQEVRGALSAATAELGALRLQGPSAAVVASSAAYVDKCAALHKASDAAAAAQAECGALHAQLSSLSARTAAQSRVAVELASAVAHDEAALRAAMAEAVASSSRVVAEAARTRDEALARTAASEADAAQGREWRARYEELHAAHATLRDIHGRFATDWAASVAAAPAVAAAIEALRAVTQGSAAGTSTASAEEAAVELAALRAEVEGARAEREGFLSMISSVSAGYETAEAQAAALLTGARQREAEVARLQSLLSKAAAEKRTWEAATAALEAQAVDAARAGAAAADALAAERNLVSSFREQVTAAEDRIAALVRERAALAARLEKPAPGSPQELRVQVAELSRQAAAGAEAAAAASRALEAETAARKRTEEDGTQLSRKLAKKEEKLVKLKAQVLSLQTAAAVAAAAAAAAAPVAAAPGGGGGGGSGAMDLGAPSGGAGGDGGGFAPFSGAPFSSDNKLWRLKEEQHSMLRALLECSQCHKNHKDTVINKCGHLFCRECIDRNIKNRNRKCPSCLQTFGDGDVRTVYFAS